VLVSVPEEDVVVIESHDAAAQQDLAHQETPPPRGTIWSAGAAGPAEAMDPDASEGLVAEGAAAPETAASETAASETSASEASASETSASETATAADTTGEAMRWREIKAMFVDDPGESVKVASGLVEQAIEDLVTSLRQRRDSLAPWESGDAADTESLRNVLRSYRSLFEQLEGMSGQVRSGQDRVTSG
jgi:ribosome-binding protein aMBF1 (putative translation factor)